MFNIENAPLAELQFQAYSRMKVDGIKETWDELCDRILYTPETGLFAIGNFNYKQEEIIERNVRELTASGSARFMWCGGTSWLIRPENWHGVFNCVSRNIRTLKDFGICMDLSMQGCGVGAIVEPRYIDQLPPVKTRLKVLVTTQIGEYQYRSKNTLTTQQGTDCFISVGDSREGWVNAYQYMIDLACGRNDSNVLLCLVDLGNVRPRNSPIAGFGGVANPEKLPELFSKVAKVLNGAVGRKLNSLECCLLIDLAAEVIVAGGIRRSAGMRQGAWWDDVFSNAKSNLWVEKNGTWRIDPDRSALRMANHTRVFHHKPTFEECVESVCLQLASGEGAIQWAGEAVARANCDLLNKRHRHKTFLGYYSENSMSAANYLGGVYQLDTGNLIDLDELEHRMGRYGLNPCGEALLNDNHCNLGTVHLANLDPEDTQAQEEAFQAAAWQTVALLERNFVEQRFQRARQYDPIVIVSWTEGFDFFTRLFGIDWVKWWAAGRPPEWQREGKEGGVNFGSYYKAKEKEFLTRWRDIVHQTVWDYCDRNGMRRPNRCTGLKPEGSLTLLTGAGCNGLHPPKSWRYIRRKSYPKDDPIAKAKIAQGYSVVPGQSDKDEQGNLLDDPFSPLCTEWLLEVPVEERLIRLYPELENYPPSQFSAAAQFDWFMQVQKYYSTHNISCTLEIRKEECMGVARLIYDAIQNDDGYISMAMLRRYDEGGTFPRYPFEPISKERYQQLRQKILTSGQDFLTLVNQNLGGIENTPQDAACDSAGCSF